MVWFRVVRRRNGRKGVLELLRKGIGESKRTYVRVRRDNQALSIAILENMIRAFEPKTVGSVKIMAYAFRAETPIGKWRSPTESSPVAACGPNVRLAGPADRGEAG